jgi:hypothetical protein
VCVHIRRKKLQEESIETNSVAEDGKQYHKGEDLPLVSKEGDNEVTESEEGVCTKQLPLLLNGPSPPPSQEKQRREAILISDFSTSVKKKHLNANIEFEEEFDVSRSTDGGLLSSVFSVVFHCSVFLPNTILRTQ